ncbi:hypothetical protein L1049_004206 [Liquidambar formosana]|uniref:Uncharacterized protein n=1 Tax=Liquidambar formosana TaxID=63359 RepID=A0AAP0RP38_LIQFO
MAITGARGEGSAPGLIKDKRRHTLLTILFCLELEPSGGIMVDLVLYGNN